MIGSMITSTQNQQVKELARLKRGHRGADSILVEGYDEIRLAVSNGATPVALYYCPPLVRAEQLGLGHSLSTERGVPLRALGESAFRHVTYREHPDGWIATFPPVGVALDQLKVTSPALVIVCASLEKPGNLGALLRTADAVGASAVIASDASTDWGNPNVVRASRGTLFTVPVARASREAVVSWLRAHDFTLVGTTPVGGVVYTEIDMLKDTAIVLGSEHDGLDSDWLKSVDVCATIPMRGVVNSLNVSITGALLLYEAQRQRRSH